jgi:3-methyladenine DNA glycosylase/8-oxoguanine DNA glycosylase
MRRRTIPLPEPFDLERTLRAFVRTSLDPTTHMDARGFWRATRTPDGPATARFERHGAAAVVSAWGPGAERVLDAAPALLGVDDDPSAFVPRHDVIREMHRRMAGVRLGRTGAVVEALVPSIVEQKVTGKEAFRSFASLVRRFGEPAPGPAGLLLQPSPGDLASLPYHAFHPVGIERRRADTVRRVCARAPRLEECTALPLPDAYARMTAFPGVGPWTAAEVARVALGDPDAVSVGDYHLPAVVAYVLAGEERADDARMLELLEPYAGQRARAIRYIEATGIVPPRRAPRRALRRIASI